jgi:hypothetical protein
MHTVHYAAVSFLVACMLWAAAMTLRPDTPLGQGGGKRPMFGHEIGLPADLRTWRGHKPWAADAIRSVLTIQLI